MCVCVCFDSHECIEHEKNPLKLQYRMFVRQYFVDDDNVRFFPVYKGH